MPNGYWNAHSDRDWEDQLHEPTDDDPYSRELDDLMNAAKAATAALYPEVRIPETPMPYDPRRLSERERASLQHAAPELYEALATALDALENLTGHKLPLGEAALRKARGGAALPRQPTASWTCARCGKEVRLHDGSECLP